MEMQVTVTRLLNEAMNMYKGALGIVALYISLGGGTK